MKIRKASVNIPAGLSGAAAVAFAKKAGEFRSEIRLEKFPQNIRGDSLLGVLNLGLRCGDTITITADGPDEEEAVNVLAQLIETDGI